MNTNVLLRLIERVKTCEAETPDTTKFSDGAMEILDLLASNGVEDVLSEISNYYQNGFDDHSDVDHIVVMVEFVRILQTYAGDYDRHLESFVSVVNETTKKRMEEVLL